jgi:hypothetical protein
MQKTIYYCDDCGGEVADSSDFYILKVAVHKHNDLLAIGTKDICESCVTKTGYSPKEGIITKHRLESGFTYWIKNFFRKGDKE